MLNGSIYLDAHMSFFSEGLNREYTLDDLYGYYYKAGLVYPIDGDAHAFILACCEF